MEAHGIKTDRICRIWEVAGKFVIYDWWNYQVSNRTFDNDADAARYAVTELGFVEIVWMD